MAEDEQTIKNFPVSLYWNVRGIVYPVSPVIKKYIRNVDLITSYAKGEVNSVAQALSNYVSQRADEPASRPKDKPEDITNFTQSLSSLCHGLRWLTIAAGPDEPKKSLPANRVTEVATQRLKWLTKRWKVVSLPLRIQRLEEMYYWLEVLVLLAALPHWQTENRKLCQSACKLLIEDFFLDVSRGETLGALPIHSWAIRLFALTLLEGPEAVKEIRGEVRSRTVNALDQIDQNSELENLYRYGRFGWDNLLYHYDLYCIGFLLGGSRRRFERILRLDPDFSPPNELGDISDLPSDLLMHYSADLPEDMLTTPSSFSFLNIERHRLTGIFNEVAVTPFSSVMEESVSHLFDLVQPETLWSVSDLKRRLQQRNKSDLRWLGETALVLHSLVGWYKFERLQLDKTADNGLLQPQTQPNVAPLLYYPFWRHLPSVPLSGIPTMRFRTRRTPEYQDLPVAASGQSSLSFSTLGECENLKAIAQESRDAVTGFVELSVHSPFQRLWDVAQFVYQCKLLSALEWIEQNTDFRWDEVSSWLIDHVLAGEDDVFVIADEDIAWNMEDISATLSILYLLGHTDNLYGHIDTSGLARSIASLQTKEGYFLGAYGEAPVRPRETCPLWNTLCALVSLGILHSTVYPRALSLINIKDLVRYLKRDTHYLRRSNRCCGDYPEEKVPSIRGIYWAMACWSILRGAYGITIPARLRDRTSARVLHIVGLQRMPVAPEGPSSEDTLLEAMVRAEQKWWEDLRLRKPEIDSPTLPSSEYVYALAILSAIESDPGVVAMVAQIGDSRSIRRGYLPLYCGLPFVVRDLPLINLGVNFPLLSFKNENALSLRPINTGGCVITDLQLGTTSQTESRFIYFDEKGLRPRFGELHQSEPIPRLNPGDNEVLLLSLPCRKKLGMEMERLQEWERWDGYGAVQTTPIGFHCSVDLGNEAIEFEGELRGKPVLFLPSESEAEAIVKTALHNSSYNEPTAIKHVQGWLRKKMKTGVTHECAEGIIRHFYRSRFTVWIRQFDSSERHFAEQLYNHLRVYSTENLYDLALTCLRQLPDDVLRTPPVIAPLATNYGQSGVHVAYYFRYALKKLFPAYQTKEVFLPLVEKGADATGKDAHWIFVDDFVGINGTQAKDYLPKWISDRHRESPFVYYLALVGFESGRQKIESWAETKFNGRPKVEVKLGQIIGEEDRPFSTHSQIFSTVEDRKKAQEMAIRIGKSILPDNKDYNTLKNERGVIEREGEEARRIHALGWEGSQALVVFPHNVPNNTLALVWAKGPYNGLDWIPLFPRRGEAT